MLRRLNRVAAPSWTLLGLLVFMLATLWLFHSGALASIPRLGLLFENGSLPVGTSASVETTMLRGYEGPWFQIYFTKPAFPEGPGNRRGGMDQAVAADIRRAQHSIRLATFDLDLQTIGEALIDAHRRGVAVQVTVDGENLEDPLVANVLGNLQSAGVGVFFDRRSAFMHNKIVVVDDSIVWTGSWNMTLNDTFRNNNNMIRLVDEQIAANYSAKLDAIFQGRGGPGQPRTKRPEVALDHARVIAMFAPDDPITDQIIEQIDDAHERIDVMAFAFTSDPIADALISARERGVAVRVVMERRNARGTGSEFERLRDAAIDAHADGNCYIMHHKAIVIDGAQVITGSFNFTSAAQQQNDENVLLIDDPSVAALYSAEFERVYDQALDPTACDT